MCVCVSDPTEELNQVPAFLSLVLFNFDWVNSSSAKSGKRRAGRGVRQLPVKDPAVSSLLSFTVLLPGAQATWQALS